MTQQPTWPRRVLQAAAIYNLLWGAWVVLFPNHWFDLTGIPRPNYPGIWQCVGMIVGVYGLGYWWAARDFAKHWPVIAVGFLGKIFGPIGFLQSVLTGALPWSWGWMILTNDLIWWIPFGAMLYLGFKYNSDPKNKFADLKQGDWGLAQANTLAKTAAGESISELSAKQDVLLVFLRHAGCTFCRETLDELKKTRHDWQQRGLLPVVVHMGTVDQGTEMMKRYELQDCPVISDTECRLFRAYQLPRGNWKQLFGMRVWIEGFKAAILKGYGFGKLVGDGFQMSGAFVVRKGEIVKAYPSKDATDGCSWKPALTAVLLLTVGWLLLGDPSAVAQTEPVNPVSSTPVTKTKDSNLQDDYIISDVKDGDRVDVIATDAKDGLVFDVQSRKGIGGFKLKRVKSSWPTKLVLRLHTKGLEQVQFVMGGNLMGGKSRTYSGEYNSSRLQESWTEIAQDRNSAGAVSTTTKPKQIETSLIQVIGSQGKPVERVRLPLEMSEYFEATLPRAWLIDENPDWVEIKWVDFWRN